ncbi:putative proteasome regulatory protein [Corynascus similis CBS 632.67]
MNDKAESKYAIHEAAREGRLTDQEPKANSKLAQLKDDDGRLPIHWAVSYNHPEIDDSGWTPFMIAASVKDSDKVADILLARGADVNQTNNNGQTALHFLASKNNLDLARKLLEGHTPAASTRVRDKRGQYPLHRAAAVGSVPMINLLIKHRSPINATDSAGQTPLHHAVAEGHELSSTGDAALALLRAGAETDKKDVDGYLALDTAPSKDVRNYILRKAEEEGIEL